MIAKGTITEWRASGTVTEEGDTGRTYNTDEQILYTVVCGADGCWYVEHYPEQPELVVVGRRVMVEKREVWIDFEDGRSITIKTS